jgi:hypothetical protein
MGGLPAGKTLPFDFHPADCNKVQEIKVHPEFASRIAAFAMPSCKSSFLFSPTPLHAGI